MAGRPKACYDLQERGVYAAVTGQDAMAVVIDLDDAQAPELSEHTPVEFVALAPSGARLDLVVDERTLEPFLRPGDARWRWAWNTGAAVGLHAAALVAAYADGQNVRRDLSLRVAPRKLDQERYEVLIADVERLARGLARSLAGVAREGALPDRQAPLVAELDERHAMLAAATARLEVAAARIARRPRGTMRAASGPVGIGEARAIDADRSMRAVSDAPVPFVRPGASEQPDAPMLLPQRVVERRSEPQSDTYENRVLRRVVEVLIQRAQLIGRLAELHAPALASECELLLRRLRELRALPLLEGVGPLNAFRGPTQLMQRDAGYREVFHVWQMLRQSTALTFDSPLLYLRIEDMPALYEVWCTLQVVQAVLDLDVELLGQQIVSIPDDGAGLTIARVQLEEDQPLLTARHGAATLRVRYQPRYRAAAGQRAAGLGSLDSHTRVPDVTIEVEHAGSVHVLVLDAKYRLDPTGRSVPPDALADAYAYLGAIGQAGQPIVSAALLLYPGLGAQEWYPSRVGALPLLPGSPAQSLSAWIGQQLHLLVS
jgi:large subunit ribosomal protein MRP49